MVQENHQEKLKIIIFQYIMLTYFISLNMNDPVVIPRLYILSQVLPIVLVSPCQDSSMS